MAAHFLHSQLFTSLPMPTSDFTDKTIIITGGNSGLGKEAARHYARLGARKIVLAVRDLDKGHAAKHDIESTTACGPSVIQVWKLDMANYSSVQKFAGKVQGELDRIDIFHANAGVARNAYHAVEGNEEMITVNVISTLLLVALIMPTLKAVAVKHNIHPTLSITTSGTHGHTDFPQKAAPEGGILTAVNDKVTAEKHWDDQYPISKLLGVFAVRSIAQRSPKSPVTINLVDPGLCQSELGRDFPTWGFFFIKLVLARSTEVGSRTLLHAGSAGEGSHGQYLEDCKFSQPSALVREGKEVQDRVWGELVEKLEKIQPNVTSEI